MKVFKSIKYALAITLLVVVTSFKPVKVYPNLTGGETQTETPILND